MLEKDIPSAKASHGFNHSWLWMSTSHLLTSPTSCRSFQPYSPNFSHPGLLSILWLCQTLSHFRDFARVVLLLRTVSLLPALQKAGSFHLLMSVQMSTPWGKTFAHQAGKAAQITHYPVFFLFVSVFVVCVCCLVSWFPLESTSTRTKNLPGAVCQCIPKALAWHTVVAPLIFAKLAILAREPSQRLWGRHLQHFYFVV